MTEMEYQHLVFEEFARKVQPAIRRSTSTTPTSTRRSRPSSPTPSTASGTRCSTTTSPRIERRTARDNDIPLLDGVPEPAGVLRRRRRAARARAQRAEQAAGAIVMGLSDQVGNELDEFVTETLRNNLLGLPLDLPTINMTRARSEGIPPLNDAAPPDLRRDQRRPARAVHELGRLRPAPQAPGVADQLRGRLRHAPDDHRSADDARPASAAAATRDRRSGRPDRSTPIPADAADFMFSTGAVGERPADRRHDHRPRQRRPLGRRPGRGHQPVRRPARHDVQLRVREPAREPAGRRPALLPGPHAGHEPAHPARGQLVRRADHAQHRRRQHAEGRRVRDGRLQVPARPTCDGTAGRLHQLAARPSPTTRPPTATRPAAAPRMPDGTIQYRTINTVDPPGINGQSRLQRHRRRRPDPRRQRQRHLLGRRRQRRHRGQRRRRRRARR